MRKSSKSRLTTHQIDAYAVVTQHIPHDITPKNRLLMGHRQGS